MGSKYIREIVLTEKSNAIGKLCKVYEWCLMFELSLHYILVCIVRTIFESWWFNCNDTYLLTDKRIKKKQYCAVQERLSKLNNHVIDGQKGNENQIILDLTLNLHCGYHLCALCMWIHYKRHNIVIVYLCVI